MKRKPNFKKGSALITTIVIALLVCILVTTMLTLSLYDQNLAKLSKINVTRQNRFDMLTDMFLKYNTTPAEDFGYHIEVYYFENGSSVMTVRSSKSSNLCEMIVEQRDGDLVKRYYNVPYEYGESTPNRTVGIHNTVGTNGEVCTNPGIVLQLPKWWFPDSAGPYYIYGKLKVERTVGINGNNSPTVFVKFNGSGREETIMSLGENTSGWLDLQDNAGNYPISFKGSKIPGDYLILKVGMNNTTGDVSVGDLIITDKGGTIVYSMANEVELNSAGDLRHLNVASYWSHRFNLNKTKEQETAEWWNNDNPKYIAERYTIEFPIVTRDTDNYVPQRVIAINQNQERCSGESSICLYKYGIKNTHGQGWYYVTGRVRVSVTGSTEMVKIAGDSPQGQFVDVHDKYDRTMPDGTTQEFQSSMSQGDCNKTVTFYNTGCWTPLLQSDGGFYKFYVPGDCEKLGEDYLKFTLWGAQGTFEVADLRVYKLSSKNATPNPTSDTCVYDMSNDSSLGSNWSKPNCALAGDTMINNYWHIHWFSYAKGSRYVGKLDYNNPGSWTVTNTLNPLNVLDNYDRKTDYDLITFSNKVGDTYNPNA